MNSFSSENYYFKNFCELTEYEIVQVLKLRNHPNIRKWMTNQDIIGKKDHQNFIKSLSGRDDLKYYLVKDRNNLFIGSVNITFLSEDKVERGIYINPLYQGMGHAKCLLSEFYRIIHQKYSVNWVVTKVIQSNIPSNALEHKLGAKPLINDNSEYNYYLLSL